MFQILEGKVSVGTCTQRSGVRGRIRMRDGHSIVVGMWIRVKHVAVGWI